jgi:hypothetical protein
MRACAASVLAVDATITIADIRRLLNRLDIASSVCIQTANLRDEPCGGYPIAF